MNYLIKPYFMTKYRYVFRAQKGINACVKSALYSEAKADFVHRVHKFHPFPGQKGECAFHFMDKRKHKIDQACHEIQFHPPFIVSPL